MVKSKRTNNDLQNTTQKPKDWAMRISLKTGGELRCSGKMSCSWSTSDINIIWYRNHIKHSCFELKKVLGIYKCLANNMSLLKYMYFTRFHVSHWYNYKGDCYINKIYFTIKFFITKTCKSVSDKLVLAWSVQMDQYF